MHSQVRANSASRWLARGAKAARSPLAMLAVATPALSSAPATATWLTPTLAAPDVGKRTLPVGSRKPDVKIAQLQNIVDLDTVPSNWFRPDQPGWTIRRSPDYRAGSIPPTVKGVYAEFRRIALPGHSCGDYRASGIIDLSQLRANGFRLVEYHYENVPAPAGYSIDMNGPPNRRPVEPAPRDMTEIHVSRAVLAASQMLDNRFPHPCWSALHVRMKVVGPAGISPLTGQPIQPRRPVN